MRSSPRHSAGICGERQSRLFSTAAYGRFQCRGCGSKDCFRYAAVPASGHIDTTPRVVLGRKRLFRGNIHAQRGLSFAGGFARLSTHATQRSPRSRDPRDGCRCTNKDTRPLLGEFQKAARSQATSSSIALSSSILEGVKLQDLSGETFAELCDFGRLIKTGGNYNIFGFVVSFARANEVSL